MAAGLLRCDRCGKVGEYNEINIQIIISDFNNPNEDLRKGNMHLMQPNRDREKNLYPSCWELIKEQFNYQP